MAYSEQRESFDTERGMEDLGLAAGRTQREKKRSYKDLLREEEEIAEQVRKSSKKRSKESELSLPVPESHKKKKKHSSDDAYHADFSPTDVKKKKKLLHPGPSSPSSDTAMDLFKAITSSTSTPLTTPQPTSSKPTSSKKIEKVLASPVGFQPTSQSSHKEHHKKSEDAPTDEHSHKAKKPKPLTLREPDGLRMKLILSPKEKTAERGFPPQESPVLSDSSSSKKSSKKSSREEVESKSSHKKHKKESHTPRSGSAPDSASSSGGELEAGELVIDDSFREVKKKKKSKKSKKKKDKQKEEKHRKHKSKRDSDGSPVRIPPPVQPPPQPPPATTASPPAPQPATLPAPAHVSHPEGAAEKKKKKEEAEKVQPKKKNMSAYQVFSKEYRSSIIAEHPGIDFGELSKKLAEVWKQLQEKDKLVWKQKAQYLQHKQNKAEATTVKRKSSGSESTPRSKGSSSSISSPHKKSPSSVVSFSSSPAKVPDTEPIDVAAHLQLLGESLSLIGHRLQETEVRMGASKGMVAVSGSLSVLLDSILCGLGPLVCLTSHVPQLNGCPKQVLSHTLDNIAYVMPGL